MYRGGGGSAVTGAPSDALPVGIMLQRLSGHLDDLAAEIDQIEHAICDELDHASTPADNRIQRLQRLDFLRQSVEDVALLCVLMAKDRGLGACRGIDPAIAEKLYLQHTKNLFATTPPPAGDAASGAAGNEVDLF